MAKEEIYTEVGGAGERREELKMAEVEPGPELSCHDNGADKSLLPVSPS
jgi:hypothetical protein